MEGLPLNIWKNFIFKNESISESHHLKEYLQRKPTIEVGVTTYKTPAKSNNCAIWFDKLRAPKSSHLSHSFLSLSVNSLQITMVEIQNLTNLGVKPHSTAQLTPY